VLGNTQPAFTNSSPWQWLEGLADPQTNGP
jgi:hypothetical protein